MRIINTFIFCLLVIFLSANLAITQAATTLQEEAKITSKDIIGAVSNPLKLPDLLNKLSNSFNNVVISSEQSNSVNSSNKAFILVIINNLHNTYKEIANTIYNITLTDMVVFLIWLGSIILVLLISRILEYFVLFFFKHKAYKLINQKYSFSGIKEFFYILKNFLLGLILLSTPIIIINIILLQIVYLFNISYYVHQILEIVFMFTIIRIFQIYLGLLHIKYNNVILLNIHKYINNFLYINLFFIVVVYILNQQFIYHPILLNIFSFAFIVIIIYFCGKVAQLFKVKIKNKNFNNIIDLLLSNKIYYFYLFLLISLALLSVFLFLHFRASSYIYSLLVRIIFAGMIMYIINAILVSIFDKKVKQSVEKEISILSTTYIEINQAGKYFNFTKVWQISSLVYKTLIYYFIFMLLTKYALDIDLFSIFIINIVWQFLLLLFFICIINIITIVLIKNKLVNFASKNNITVIKSTLSAIILCYKPYKIMLYILFGLGTLGILKVSIVALLASTSIITFVVAFGAKDILQNFFNAILFLLEGSFFVNDIVEIAGKVGMVESISLVYVKIRDLEGKLHMVPFSKIDIITNYTKDFTYCVIDCGVAYNTNVGNVYTCLQSIIKELRSNEKYAEFILDDIEILGVTSLNDFSINIRCRVRTVAGKHNFVKWAVLERVHDQFPKNGIEIPFPIKTLYIKNN